MNFDFSESESAYIGVRNKDLSFSYFWMVISQEHPLSSLRGSSPLLGFRGK